MIIVRILGGLGNQMFQYAHAKALQIKGYEVKLDISNFKTYKLHGGYHLDKFKISLQNADATSILFTKINPINILREKSLLFDQKMISLKGNEYLKGYFQTEKYFLEIRNTLLDEFVLNTPFTNTTKQYSEKINNTKTSCSLHIRRGDYITDTKAHNIHGICSLNYYEKAILYFEERYKDVTFFVFSDDIAWAKENLNLKNGCFIEHKCLPHEDMYLMSICLHNITANSSFSWWGAWLNQHKQKTVIAPKQWFVAKENEIACANWIKI